MRALIIVTQFTIFQFIKYNFIDIDERLHICSQRTLGRRIGVEFKNTQNNLKTLFTNLEYFSSAVDIWSANKESYLGITLHWVSI